MRPPLLCLLWPGILPGAAEPQGVAQGWSDDAWKAHSNASHAEKVYGARFVGKGWCLDNKDGHVYAPIAVPSPCGNLPAGGPGARIHACLQRCADTAATAASLQPAVLGFEFASDGGCVILAAPGFATDGAKQLWTPPMAQWDDNGGIAIPHAAHGNPDHLCYKLHLMAAAKHKARIKKLAARVCAGSKHRRQITDGGNVCCEDETGMVCCIGPVADAAGRFKVAVACAGDSEVEIGGHEDAVEV